MFSTESGFCGQASLGNKVSNKVRYFKALIHLCVSGLSRRVSNNTPYPMSTIIKRFLWEFYKNSVLQKPFGETIQ